MSQDKDQNRSIVINRGTLEASFMLFLEAKWLSASEVEDASVLKRERNHTCDTLLILRSRQNAR